MKKIALMLATAAIIVLVAYLLNPTQTDPADVYRVGKVCVHLVASGSNTGKVSEISLGEFSDESVTDKRCFEGLTLNSPLQFQVRDPTDSTIVWGTSIEVTLINHVEEDVYIFVNVPATEGELTFASWHEFSSTDNNAGHLDLSKFKLREMINGVPTTVNPTDVACSTDLASANIIQLPSGCDLSQPILGKLVDKGKSDKDPTTGIPVTGIAVVTFSKVSDPSKTVTVDICHYDSNLGPKASGC